MSKRQTLKPAHPSDLEDLSKLGRQTFPALTQFVRGYLHEDFAQVHGSVRGAAAAFCADATPNERRELAEELIALAGIAANRPVRELRRFVASRLGSGWNPRSRAELVELADLVRAAP